MIRNDHMMQAEHQEVIDLLNNNPMMLYHGSEFTIDQPSCAKGKVNNDYGRGFYNAINKELAKEWAVKNDQDGYCNIYTLNVENLKVLNLCEYGVENWIAILMQYRTFSDLDDTFDAVKQVFIKKYGIECEDYDIIIGYRADDSYFTMAKDFVNGVITKEVLYDALRLGLLGLQVCLKSEKAFDYLSFKDAECVEAKKYYEKYQGRDSGARHHYREIRKAAVLQKGTKILDLLDEGDGR